MLKHKKPALFSQYTYFVKAPKHGEKTWTIECTVHCGQWRFPTLLCGLEDREDEIIRSGWRWPIVLVGDYTTSSSSNNAMDWKQVHSLCVDSRPGDRLRLAKGHHPLIILLLLLLSSGRSSRPAFGDGREKKTMLMVVLINKFLIYFFILFQLFPSSASHRLRLSRIPHNKLWESGCKECGDDAHGKSLLPLHPSLAHRWKHYWQPWPPLGVPWSSQDTL